MDVGLITKFPATVRERHISVIQFFFFSDIKPHFHKNK